MITLNKFLFQGRIQKNTLNNFFIYAVYTYLCDVLYMYLNKSILIRVKMGYIVLRLPHACLSS